MAKRRGWWARFWRGASRAVPSWRSCGFMQICRAGADAEFAREIMVFMGLLVDGRSPPSSWSASATSSACWLTRAWSTWASWCWASASAAWPFTGPCLHLINNGLTKGVLFLSAGNIHRAYGSKLTDDVQGAIERVPLSGGLFLAGFLAITGSPPFGPFVSEFTIVSAAAGSGQYIATGLFLLLLGVVFIGMGATVLAVVQGKPGRRARNQTGFTTA